MFCIKSLITADFLVRAAIDKVASEVKVIPVGYTPMSVERNSSPTRAVSAGITIGQTSVYVPVFTKTVVFGFTFASNPVKSPASITSLINVINVETCVPIISGTTPAGLYCVTVFDSLFKL